MVYIIYDCRKIISCWCRDNNLTSTCLDMSRSFLFRCVETCTLKYYVNAKITPWAICSISLSINLNLFTINCDRILTSGYSISLLIFTLRRIILQQMSKHLRACQIVDCYYFITFCSKHLSECKTSDTAKTIDCYFYCHDFQFLLKSEF